MLRSKWMTVLSIWVYGKNVINDVLGIQRANLNIEI